MEIVKCQLIGKYFDGKLYTEIFLNFPEGLPSDGSTDGTSLKCRLLPELGQVVDLLQNLPDATSGRSPSLQHITVKADQTHKTSYVVHGNTLPHKTSNYCLPRAAIRRTGSISEKLNTTTLCSADLDLISRKTNFQLAEEMLVICDEFNYIMLNENN